jgi:beta-fructofuranosidase
VDISHFEGCNNNSLFVMKNGLCVQLDVEVVFDYPDVSSVQAADEAKFNNGYDFSQAGYANQGIFGPFGLLVLTDENFQEQTAVFFYIVHLKDGQWTTRFCNDQSRYDKRV